MRFLRIFCLSFFVLAGCAGPEKEYPGEVKTRDSYYTERKQTQSYDQVASQMKKQKQAQAIKKKKCAHKKVAKQNIKAQQAQKQIVQNVIVKQEAFKAPQQKLENKVVKTEQKIEQKKVAVVQEIQERKPLLVALEEETQAVQNKTASVETLQQNKEVQQVAVKPVVENKPVVQQKIVKQEVETEEIPTSVVVVYEEVTEIPQKTPAASSVLTQEETEKLAYQEAPTPDAIAMVLAILDSDAQTLNSLIKVGGDVKAKSETGETFLFTAAKYSVDPDIINILVENGAQLNDQDVDGRTPLMIGARYTTTPAVVFRMLDLGADVSIKDKNGDTALEYARNNPNGQTIYDEIKSRQNPKYLKITIILLSILVLLLLWRRKK